jgi:hypothetical protein
MAKRKKTKGQTTVIEFIFTTEPRVLSYNMLKKKDNYKVSGAERSFEVTYMSTNIKHMSVHCVSINIH